MDKGGAGRSSHLEEVKTMELDLEIVDVRISPWTSAHVACE